MPFWKQDILVAFAVAMYLALVFGAVEIWSLFSHQADDFTGTVEHIQNR